MAIEFTFLYQMYKKKTSNKKQQNKLFLCAIKCLCETLQTCNVTEENYVQKLEKIDKIKLLKKKLLYYYIYI